VNTRSLLVPILRAAAALLLAGSAPAAAQTGGSVEGVARSAKDGAPLSLLLIRLVPVVRQAEAPQGVVTDAQGRFRFADVPAGEYRLQVEQIGHERTLSPVLGVRPGGAVQQDIRSTMVPIQLAGITVGGRCLTAAQLPSDLRLAALWNEARKGVETRRAFALQYRYLRTFRQEITLKPRIGKTQHETREEIVISDPDSIRARERRLAVTRRSEGYGTQRRTSFTLSLPNETELLSDEFLRDHCLESAVLEDEGAYGLRFRPVRIVGDRVDIQGAVWVDAKTFLIRRLDLEYLDGRRAAAQGTIEYEDTPIGGSVLRLPARGQLSGRPGGMLGAAIVRIHSDLSFGYRDFQRVRRM
jgi:hypothetical protein